MRRLGILDLVGLGATLVFALPIGINALRLVRSGRVALGVTGLVVAIGLVAVERLLWTPSETLSDVLQWIVGRAVDDPSERR